MIWGIAGAFADEVQPVIKKIQAKKKSRWGTRSLFIGKISDIDVIVMTTGIGKVNTASSIQYLLNHYPVQTLIFAGVAGALNPEVKIGDVVISRDALQHDFDIGGKVIFEQMGISRFKADPLLIELAIKTSQNLRLGKRVHVGTILTGDQAIIDSDKKHRLWTAFRGDCVDMEGAAAGSVCAYNDIPFILIKAISDSADERAREDFRRSRSRACMEVGRVVLGMLAIQAEEFASGTDKRVLE